HAHVVSPATVHAALRKLSASEEVAATYDDRDLRLIERRCDFSSNLAHNIRVHTERAAAEGLTGKLEQYPALTILLLTHRFLRSCSHCGRPGITRHCQVSKPIVPDSTKPGSRDPGFVASDLRAHLAECEAGDLDASSICTI